MARGTLHTIGIIGWGGRCLGNNGFECSIAFADTWIPTVGRKKGFAGERGCRAGVQGWKSSLMLQWVSCVGSEVSTSILIIVGERVVVGGEGGFA
ncbi:hypothetical protein CDAR_390101 [Caerostris darwini]|uniref:Uncharacterized protein n=1 Tax=Caerostris darwini TaxID=1538125 RepID=A0AAV4WMF2_9ARAC|nr:hypothetical protein CDAR_390101 [Caerostris darwini]